MPSCSPPPALPRRPEWIFSHFPIPSVPLVVYRYTFPFSYVASCLAVNIDSLTAISKDRFFQLKCHRYSLPLTDIMTRRVRVIIFPSYHGDILTGEYSFHTTFSFSPLRIQLQVSGFLYGISSQVLPTI